MDIIKKNIFFLILQEIKFKKTLKKLIETQDKTSYKVIKHGLISLII